MVEVMKVRKLAEGKLQVAEEIMLEVGKKQEEETILSVVAEKQKQVEGKRQQVEVVGLQEEGKWQQVVAVRPQVKGKLAVGKMEQMVAPKEERKGEGQWKQGEGKSPEVVHSMMLVVQRWHWVGNSVVEN